MSRARVPVAMEKEFAAQIDQLARLNGWPRYDAAGHSAHLPDPDERTAA